MRRRSGRHLFIRQWLAAVAILMVSGCCSVSGPPSRVHGEASSGMLEVVDTRQGTSYTCGIAAAQAILNYYGIDKREDQLVERFGATEAAGTSPAQLIAGFETFGLAAAMKENTTLEDLRANLKNKIPTMVAIQAWSDAYPSPDWKTSWEDGHWAIVIGLDEKYVYFEDPSLLGTRGWLTHTEFLDRWHDYTGEAPCCDANDRTFMHLSISVKGIPDKRNMYTHMD